MSLPVKKKERKIVMETVRRKHEDMKEKEKERLQEFLTSRSRMRVIQWLEANCINTDSLKTIDE